jgi:hypothetical protein
MRGPEDPGMMSEPMIKIMNEITGENANYPELP